MNEKFSRRLKELRLERGITQEELSKITGVSFPTISRYEKGHRDEPKLSILRVLSNYFDVPLDYMAGESDIRDKDLNAGEISRIFNELNANDKRLLMDLAKSLRIKEGK